MIQELEQYVRGRQQGGIDVPTMVQLLRRFLFLERSAARVLAGWFLALPDFEAKIDLGYQLWAHAERADLLRQRLSELRGGHREANLDPATMHLGEELVHAPDGPSMLAAEAWLLSSLQEGYRAFVALCDPSANAMEARTVQRFLPELEQERQKLQRWQQAGQAGSVAGQWTAYLAGLLEKAGGLSGVLQGVSGSHAAGGQDPPRPDGPRFIRPATLVFDERLQRGDFQSYEERMALPFEARRSAEFEIFFNEFYAAALAASIIFDAWNAQVPWEFLYEACHQFWDEVRHVQFGLLRLRELGEEPRVLNVELYEKAQDMPFLHRLCYLTLGLEVYFMPRKGPRVRRYEQAGDHRTQLFADVDWSDEGNHVRNGRKWVQFFLEDDNRSIEDLQREIDQHLQRKDALAGKTAAF